MKSILYAVLFLLVPKLCISQATSVNKTIFLDSLFRETSKTNHTYYRVIKDYYSTQKRYEIKEYYKSGVLKMEGISTNKEGFPIEGEQTYYYENGNKKSITNYIKGLANGQDIEWYENGNKKLEGEYIEDKKKRTSQNKINQFWNEDGVQKVVDGNGFFEGKLEKEGFEGFEEISKGEIKNGFKEGTWEGLSKKPNYNYKETYKNGMLVSGVSTGKDGKTCAYTELEIKPEPKNGMMDFYKFIARNFRTPSNPGLKGKVYITFIVNEDGKIVEPKILRDLGYGTGNEAIRVVTAYNNFAPGLQRGRKVRCAYSLPITIQSAN